MRRRELIVVLSGVALAVPWPIRAQQKPTPVIGYLNGTTPEANAPQLAAFRQGLSETGWVEGQNLKIEYRWAEFHYDRLPGLAAELVGRKVHVLAACGGADEAIAARDTTSTIPLVFMTGAARLRPGSWPASRGPAAIAPVSPTSPSCYGKSDSSWLPSWFPKRG